MKAAVSARLAEVGRLRSARRSPDESVTRKTRRERPVTSATASSAEAVEDLVQRRLHRRQRRELLDQGIAGGHCFLAQDRVALGVSHRPRHQVAFVVGERLLQLHREGVGQILQARLPWRQVDGDVLPFRDGNPGDAPVQQSLAGGDQLDDAGMAGLEIGLDRPDQRGAFHGR